MIETNSVEVKICSILIIQKKYSDCKIAEVEKVCEIEKRIEITVRLKRKAHICPCCCIKTDKIHDYRIQRIKDLSAFGKPVVIILRKRRYACECGKRFFEENNFVGIYQRRTFRTTGKILMKLKSVCSYKSVADEFGVSPSNVMRLFKAIKFPNPTVFIHGIQTVLQKDAITKSKFSSEMLSD